MTYKKASIYTMVAAMSKFAFLLIIPLIREFLIDINSLNENLASVSTDIVFLFLVLLYSFLEYRSAQYALSDNSIIIKKGFLLKKVIEIPYDKIHYIRIKRSIFSRLFSSCKIIFGTPNKYRRDTNIFIKRKDINAILNAIFDLKEKNISYKISNSKIFFMSIMWSNIFASLLIAVPFINKVGTIVGKELSSQFYSSIDKSKALIKIGIPPIVATLSFLLISFFLISIIAEFLRYSNFQVKDFSNCILIKRGFIGNEEKIIKKKCMNAVAIKQTLWMKLLKIYSAYVYTIGYSQDRTDKSLLIVALNKEKLFPLLNELCLKKLDSPTYNKIKCSSMKSFLLWPALCLTILFAGLAFLNFQKWYHKITSLIIYFFIPFCLWWLIIRFLAYKNTSLQRNDQHFIVGGYDKFSLYNSYIPLENIQSIIVQRNIFQRIFGKCNISVYVISDLPYRFYCKQLRYSIVKNFVDKV